MLQKRTYLLSALFVLLTTVSFAQKTGSIKGFVYDKSTGEPMIYTNVHLLGTKYGAQTDVNGFYSISQIPAGEYTLFCTVLGYDTVQKSIALLGGQVISKKIYLKPQATQLANVEINAHKTDKLTKVDAGVTTITPHDIELLPSAGGEPDVTQYLQVVPGVIFTGDQGGQLYIRGGAPSQTGIMLDGVTIYNPFHSIGLYSVFETDAIRSVDVQTAGFNAEYGNRTSAIMNVHTIDGNKNHVSGLVAVSPIMSHIMLDGPLVKAKKEDGTSVTYVLSGKTCYLDQTSKSIYGGLNTTFNNGLPYKFNDLYGKISVNSANGSKVNAFGFSFDDQASLQDPTASTAQETSMSTVGDFHWKAKGGGATFVVSPSGASTLIDGKFAYSKYDITASQVGSPASTSSINGFETGINFTNFLPGYSELKYGIEVNGYHTTLGYRDGLASTSLDRQNTIAGLFVVWRKDVNDKLVLEPSLRIQYYSEIAKMSPEPRIGIKYNLTQNVRLKAAAGLYSQDIISTRNYQDIVNFFTGFLLSPDQTLYDPNGSQVTSNLQTAYHIMGGVEVDINRVELNFEPWIKNFTQNITLNNHKLFPSNPDFVAGSGKAYGADLSARYVHNKIYLWGVVSYQNINYTSVGPDGSAQTFPAPFDRRWNINFVGSYTMGKKRDWIVSARWNLGSPFPFTRTQGQNESISLADNGIGTNYLQANGIIHTTYSAQLNDGRLSYYHRLDLSVKKIFHVAKRSTIDADFSVTNVYDRNNIFYVNRTTNSRIYQLPLFPSLSLAWRF